MTFNVDLNKKIKIQQQEMQSSNTAEVKSTPVNVPVGKVENTNSDIYTKLGITKDEYLKFCNENPNFATLMFEEQLKYIQSIKNTVPPTVTTTNEDPQTVEVTQVVATTGEEQADAPKKMSKESIIEFFGIDKEAYNKMSVEEKFNVYASELAKNKFIYNEENPQDIDAWNALSEEERNKLVENAKKDYLHVNGDMKELFNSDNSKINKFLDIEMTNLLAANKYEISIDTFNNKTNNSDKLEYLHDYINELAALAPEQLSEYDKEFIADEKLVSDSLNYLMKQKNPNHEEVIYCPAQARQILKKEFNNLTTSEAKYTYLKAQVDAGKTLDTKQAQEFKALDKFINSANGQKILKSLKDNTANEHNIPQDFNYEITNSEYGDAYIKAPSKTARAFVVQNYLASLKENPDKFKEALNHYVQSLTVDEVEQAQLVIAQVMVDTSNEEFKTIVNNNGNTNLNRFIANQSDKINGNGAKLDTLGETFESVTKNNPEEGESLYDAVFGNLNPDNEASLEFTKHASGSASEDVQRRNVEFGTKISDDKLAIEQNKQVRDNSTAEVRGLSLKNLHKSSISQEAKQTIFENQTSDGNAKVVNAAADSVAKTFDKDHETKAAKTVYDATKKLNEKDAIEAQKKLANQVEHFDASNQAEIHKMVSQSQYEEVVKQAAQNIYKYDESAQKEALKYTLETGNKEAIEVAISNVDKCKGLTNETSTVPSNNKNFDTSLAKEIRTQQIAIEEKYTASVAAQYADFMTEQDVRSGLVLADEKSKTLQKYIEEFKSPSSNKFALLGKLEPGLKKAAIKMLVKYAPTMINSFIDMGYGTQILNSIGETSDMAVKIVNIMDFKGQPEVRNVVQRHPEHYEELYVKYFMDNEKPEISQAYTTTPTNFVSMFKQMNKDGKTIFKV